MDGKGGGVEWVVVGEWLSVLVWICVESHGERVSSSSCASFFAGCHGRGGVLSGDDQKEPRTEPKTD